MALSRGVAAAAGSVSSSESSGSCSSSHGSAGHGHWWDHEYEYLHLECYILCALVWLALIFDVADHWLTHIARDVIHSKNEDDAAHEVHREAQVSMWEEVMHKFSEELMVLGFLAFVVWASNRAGFFERITDSLGKSTDAEPRLPPSGYDYLHMVEDVHMQIFVAMILYFIILSIAVIGTSRAEKQWQVANETIVTAHGDSQNVRMDDWICTQSPVVRNFFESRCFFFSSLQDSQMRWEALRTELLPVLSSISQCDDLVVTLDSGEKSREGAVPYLLKPWFPFHQFLELQVRYLVGNLMEIKATTWAAYSLVQLVQAQLLRELKTATWAYVWFMVLGLALAILVAMTIYRMYFNRTISSDTRSRMSVRSSMTSVHAPDSSISSISSGSALRSIMSNFSQAVDTHRNYPWMAALRMLQFSLFGACLTVVRFIISKHWWEESMHRALSCAMLIGIGVPCTGIGLGKLLPKLSMKLANAEFMQEHQLQWLRVILVDFTDDSGYSRSSFRQSRNSKMSTLSKSRSKGNLLNRASTTALQLQQQQLQEDDCRLTSIMPRDLGDAVKEIPLPGEVAPVLSPS